MNKLLLSFLFLSTAAIADPLVVPPILPNETMTPGVVDPAATKEKICVPGYTQTVRNVPQSLKNQVYQEYGIFQHKPREYEIDHLISLELGGSNDIKNLWPQSYVTQPWNARVKDKLENKLHSMICDDQITVEEAQKLISGNWIDSYCKIFHVTDCSGIDSGPQQK